MFDTRRTARNLFRGKRYYLSAVNGLLLYATVPLNELLRQTVHQLNHSPTIHF